MTAAFNIRMPTEAELAKYREASLREVMEANRPRLLNTISTVQTALAETPKVKEKP